MPRKREEMNEVLEPGESMSPEEKITCCGKKFTQEEYYWHKRKCH